MKTHIPLCSVLLLTTISATAVAEGPPGLQPWSENPWYWSYRGEPVLLLGGSDDDNLFQWPDDELIAQLERLQKAGGNVIRNTMSDRQDKGFEVYPFKQRPDGKFDLCEWNDEYWIRFERLLEETAKRRIFVQIEIWDRFDYTDSGNVDRWQSHPYNPKNNINYTFAESGFEARYSDHPGANKQPFFFTTPKQRDNHVVLPFQQEFVKKLLAQSLRHDHVLYCIDNETSGEEEWARYWAQFFKKMASERGKQIHVTEMWDPWDLTDEMHKQTFDHPEVYGFVDVSQNNHNKGENHWNKFLYVRDYLSTRPRPINTTKTYGADANKFGHTDADGIERFWRHLLGGGASVRFHRPDSGLGLSDKAVASIRAARKLESRIPLWTVQPANKLLSEREPNEAYLAANVGKAYAIYFPNQGTIRLDLSAAKGLFIIHWIDIASGEWGPRQEIASAESVALSPPQNGYWVAAIVPQDE